MFTFSLLGNPPNQRRSVYGSYLFFQLFSHKSLYEDDGEDVIQSTKYADKHPHRESPKDHVDSALQSQSRANTFSSSAQATGHSEHSTGEDLVQPPVRDSEAAREPEEETEEPQMSVWMTIALLVVVAVVCSVLAYQGKL